MLFLRASCSWAFSSSGSLGLVTGGGNGGLLGDAGIGIDCPSVTGPWSESGSAVAKGAGGPEISSSRSMSSAFLVSDEARMS
eukprot:5320348-Amphidinium_carterae.1